jgi:pimeloyl-ACP methyl ester carboxylesterase
VNSSALLNAVLIRTARASVARIVAATFALAFALFAPRSLAAPESLPAGKSKLTLTVRGTTFDVFTCRPASFRDGPLLVVMHGLGRNAEGYRDYATSLADQLHALVVAPHFPKDRFPTETYQRGGILLGGKPQPREQWTFQCVSDLAALVRQREGRPEMPLYLLGHSAGAQILHRMAAFLPGDARRIVAANPGSLLFPTLEQKYPFGFGGLPPELSGDEQIKAYLAAPLTLYLGTSDVLDKDLHQSPEAMRQGRTRFERGHACFAMAQALAKERGWPFNWRLVEAPDMGHSARAMFTHPNAVKSFSAASDEAAR